MVNRQIYIQTIFQSFGPTLALDPNDKNNEKGLYTGFASANDMFITLIRINLSFYFRSQNLAKLYRIFQKQAVQKKYTISQNYHICFLFLDHQMLYFELKKLRRKKYLTTLRLNQNFVMIFILIKIQEKQKIKIKENQTIFKYFSREKM